MEKLRFLVPLGSVCRQRFAGFIAVLLDVKSLVEHAGSRESERFSSYACFCNVLHICNIRVIPTYRVYRFYDMSMNNISSFAETWRAFQSGR